MLFNKDFDTMLSENGENVVYTRFDYFDNLLKSMLNPIPFLRPSIDRLVQEFDELLSFV